MDRVGMGMCLRGRGTYIEVDMENKKLESELKKRFRRCVPRFLILFSLFFFFLSLYMHAPVF